MPMSASAATRRSSRASRRATLAPNDHPQATVGQVAARPPGRVSIAALRVAELVASAAVRAARAHDAAEVEREHGEPAVPRARCGSPTGSGGPCSRRARDAGGRSRRSPRGSTSGRRSSPSSETPSSVVNGTGSTVCDDGSHDRGATTARHGLRAARPVALARVRGVWPDWARSSATARCSCPRSPGATHSRRSTGLAGETVADRCSGPASSRWARGRPRADGDGGRDRARASGGPGRSSASAPGRPPRGARRAAGPWWRSGRRARAARRCRDADRSVLALDPPVPIWIAALGPRALRLAGRGRRRGAAELVPARAGGAGSERRRGGAEAAGRDPAR